MTEHDGSRKSHPEWRRQEIPRGVLESDALRINLEETAVKQVSVDPKYAVLQETVTGYRGIQKAADNLLFELNHPYKNWEIILPELQDFAAKYFSAYAHHPKGAQAMGVIIDVFQDAIMNSGKDSLAAKGIEYLLHYLQKIISEMDGLSREDIYPVLQHCFQSLASLPEKKFFFLASSHIPLKRVGQVILRKLSPENRLSEFNGLLVRALQASYRYWLQEEDPRLWFNGEEERSVAPVRKEADIFERLSHRRLREYLDQVEQLAARDGSVDALRSLLSLPGYLEIVRGYKEIPAKLSALWGEWEEKDRDQLGQNRKIQVLFKIMEVQGLRDIHEEVLREINRTLIDLIQKAPPEGMQDFIRKTFSLLKSSFEKYPQTALQCIQAIGAEVFNRAYIPMVELFLEQVLRFGFQYPGVQGVNANWQLICNSSHLMNVRIWLDIITRNPKWCSTLLSALIINLKLGGTCIKDTDLFQKEITKLLNAEIEPVYNLIKQLTKMLPVHFNEIGAEGRLRDTTTEIDEICDRKDPLIHFLRKQSHVESSNLIEGFIREIFRFWRTKEPTGLRKYIPPEIYETLETKGPLTDEVNRILVRVFSDKRFTREEDLLRLTDHELDAIMNQEPDLESTEKKRVALLVQIYRLVDQKYNLGFREIRYHLQEASRWGFEGLDSLQKVLDRNDTQECLENLIAYLEGLKEIIISPQQFEAREDIYHKRHIAVDIPSLYGRYQEKKFDALGLTLRLENLANIYFERLIDSLDLSFVTRATFFELIRAIRYFFRAMQVDGISSIHLDKHLKLLEKSLDIKRFSFTQYMDIFRGFSEGVKDILSVYYVNAHKANLENLIRQMGRDNILPQYLQGIDAEAGSSEFVNQIREKFLRDLVATTFGLQYLDNFLTRIQVTLAEQKETLQEADLDLLMTYDPKKVSCSLHQPNPLTNDLIHLGSKGYNLVLLASEGVPVPPGFILTTEVFRCRRIIQDYKYAHDHFEREIQAGIQQIERVTGKKYGSSSQPLLLAIRSGSAISMPGMMATVLNVGLNEEIVESLARTTGSAWFAWDNYRRFVQSWGMSFGMKREVFNEIMQSFKSRYKVEKKRQFSGEEMKKMALTYRRAVEESKIALPEKPWTQLQVAIEQVLNSWESIKARQYREIMGISDAWGTAVIAQEMVFGNLDLYSGTGVVFTSPPSRIIRRVALWGDFTPGNQGEDIVGGLVSTFPISKEQKETDEREGDLTLEENYPEIYKKLLEIAKNLVYENRWNPQEVEFTFENSKETGLYILQTRDMVSGKGEKLEVFSPSEELQKNFIGKGIGVSGGALSGKAVFKLEEIQRLRKKEPGTPLVLVRSDTVPEDIKAISLTDGLLTAKGGQTSHASIVAFELGKTAIVGCHNLVVMENKGRFMIGNTLVKQGEYISLDGKKGLVYLGKHEIKAEGELYTGLI